MAVQIDEVMAFYDFLEGKHKDTTRRSEDKLRTRLKKGVTMSRGDGTLVCKDWRIDRDNRRYYEHVEDLETGKVIVHKDEPLTEHRGHGSDKFEKR